MPGKYSIIICTLMILCYSLLAYAPETSPAMLCGDELRLEAQKMAILKGESGLRHYDARGNLITGDSGRALGIAQFHRATFNRLKKLAGRPELNIKIMADQLWLFDWAIRNGHAHNWTVARWVAAEGNPAFPIDKKYIFKKGSQRCPTAQQVKKAQPPEEPPAPVPVSAPAGPVYELPLKINHADMAPPTVDV